MFRVFKSVKKLTRKYSKLSYIHNPGTEPLQCLTIGKLLAKSVEKYGDRMAIKSRAQNQSLSYQEVLHKADKLAAGLRTIGLNVGDRVAIWAPNIIEWYLTHMACARGGYVLVNINPAYTPSELQNCVNLVDVKCIICPDTFKTQNYYKILNQIDPEISNSDPGKLKSKALPTLKSIIIASDETFKGSFMFDEIIGRSSDDELKKIHKIQDLINPDSLAHVQFTSGTTGQPKAPIQSHFHLVNNSYFVGKRNELDKKHHIICLQIPFFHAFATSAATCAAVNHGSTIVLPTPGFDGDKSLDAIKEDKCTVIYGTPTMYVDLVMCQKRRQENINPEIAVTGGATCSPHLFKEMKKFLHLKKVKSVYGQTELTAIAFQSLYDDDYYQSTETVGYVGDHLEAKVVNAEGKIVPRGTQGELCIRGYSTTLGYWKDEAKTKELISVDKWLRTGDQFVIEENGYGKIVGRLKEMIIRGGENIYPREIEDLLNTHPNILETHVIGLPHERLGEEVCACIRTDGSKLNLNEIKDFCKGKIAHFKIPSVLEIVKTFPKTATGKIQKFKLKDMVKSINEDETNSTPRVQKLSST